MKGVELMNEKDEFIEDDFIDDQEIDTIVLTLDDDSEIVCDVIGIFDLDDEKYSSKEYIALGVQDSDEVFLYGYVEDEEGNFDLIVIEDDDELVAVSNKFEELDGLLDEEL